MLTIYSSPNCSGCNALKTFFNSVKIPFQMVDVTNPSNAQAREFFTGQGHRSVPQVYAGETYIGDFNTTVKVGAADLMRLATKEA